MVEKWEIAHTEQFLLIPQCFLLNQILASPFFHIFDTISSFAAEFEEPKIGISGKVLNSFIVNYTDFRIVSCCPQYQMINPLLNDKILDWSKLKQIADDILKCI